MVILLGAEPAVVAIGAAAVKAGVTLKVLVAKYGWQWFLAGSVYVAGDRMAQYTEYKRGQNDGQGEAEPFVADMERTKRACLIGAAWCGPFVTCSFALQNMLFPGYGLLAVGAKALIVPLVISPINIGGVMYLHSYLTPAAQGGGVDTGLRVVAAELPRTAAGNFVVAGPWNLFMFSAAPTEMQLPLSCCFALGIQTWVCYRASRGAAQIRAEQDSAASCLSCGGDVSTSPSYPPAVHGRTPPSSDASSYGLSEEADSEHESEFGGISRTHMAVEQ